MKDSPTGNDHVSGTTAVETFAVGDRQQARTHLADAVRAFAAAWSQADQPPSLQDFLPHEPAGLRLLTLIELIKVDLRHRWQRQLGKQIEQYLVEFPELIQAGELPCDVIVEEYQVRQQMGHRIELESFLARFPSQTTALRRLLDDAPATISTAIVSPERPESFQVGQKVDDFELLVRLGQGAFAAVFLARQISMQRLVALKVSADRGHEPQTLAQLDHPNIVRVFDQRTLPEQHLRLLYMQYVSGGTLLDVVNQVQRTLPADRSGRILLEAVEQTLATRGDTPPSESSLRRFLSEATWPEAICWLGARLAEALDYAHQRGVLHRDIKPANVLLASDGSPKLADFNISYCSKLDGATAAAYMGGSLAYMSPEQLEACDPAHDRAVDELDGRSDLFSLAVMLFELLTGRRPYPDLPLSRSWSQTLRQYAEQRRQGVGDDAWQRAPNDCPPQLLEVLRSSLSAERALRPATAGLIARQLQLCLQPSVQRLLKPPRQTWAAWLRLHPTTAVCLAGLIPNAIASGLNIAYNFQEIIRHLTAIDALPVFHRQVAIINPVAFAIGTYLVLRFAWPVLSALRTPQKITTPNSYALQHRALRIGDRVAWVSGIEWIVSGIVFPLWLHWEVGPALHFSLHDFIHFMVSQVICGLLAATQAFFLLTTVVVHGLLASLIRPDHEHEESIEWLRQLLQRSGRMFYLAMALPFLAITAFVVADVKASTPFVVMAGLGFASFALSYRLFGLIQADVESLTVAVGPLADLGPLSVVGSPTASHAQRMSPKKTP